VRFDFLELAVPASHAHLDETRRVGQRHRLGACVDAQLREDPLHMARHRLRRDEELLCDLAGRAPLRDQLEDLHLAFRSVEGRLECTPA